ncbi:hypothetical protein L332_01865 [Agrococcus pavilionensis RW1]|uniref:Uncharacterized protein n=1 Tax=Agrococcus pavilionensis RW1 TaxID=1330458 RepID=U1LMN1_9MICO|nr:hypothetical protein L332_01865 [Agrococcus pavilionensis RW1]
MICILPIEAKQVLSRCAANASASFQTSTIVKGVWALEVQRDRLTKLPGPCRFSSASAGRSFATRSAA